MRKIIYGRKYDTEKAERLITHTYGQGWNDFNYRVESLYRTPRSHRYFLAGEGGPMTRYAHSCSDGTACGGENIFPISEEQAKKLVESWAGLDTEDYERIFGEAEEA